MEDDGPRRWRYTIEVPALEMARVEHLHWKWLRHRLVQCVHSRESFERFDRDVIVYKTDCQLTATALTAFARGELEQYIHRTILDDRAGAHALGCRRFDLGVVA